MENENNNGFGTENQQNDANSQNYYSQSNQQPYYSQSNDQTNSYGQTAEPNVQQNYYSQNAAQSTQYDQNAQQNAYGQQYGAQQNAYSQQQYGTQQNYSAYGYNANNANNGGSAPLDKKGQPLKNRFGMKMTFAILEMLSCNMISLVCGVIACIFSSKANTSYKEGRWDEFKSQARTSAICLWIGLVGVIISIITGIVVGVVTYNTLKEELGSGYEYDYDDYEYEYDDDDYDSDDYDFSYDTESEIAAEPEEPATEAPATEATETPSVPLNVTPSEGFTTPVIKIEGIEITLPLSYADLKAAGFYVETEDEEYILNGGEYDSADLFNANGDELGYVYIGNMTDNPISCKEGTVFGFDFYYADYEDYITDIELYNGITQEATAEDLIAGFGAPDDEYHGEDDYATYQWYNHNDEYYDSSYNSVEFVYMDGGLWEVTFRYMGWD